MLVMSEMRAGGCAGFVIAVGRSGAPGQLELHHDQ